MEYKDMFDAVQLKEHKETIYRLKDKILPEVWEEIEKYFEEIENGNWTYSRCNRYRYSNSNSR